MLLLIKMCNYYANSLLAYRLLVISSWKLTMSEWKQNSWCNQTITLAVHRFIFSSLSQYRWCLVFFFFALMFFFLFNCRPSLPSDYSNDVLITCAPIRQNHLNLKFMRTNMFWSTNACCVCIFLSLFNFLLPSLISSILKIKDNEKKIKQLLPFPVKFLSGTI